MDSEGVDMPGVSAMRINGKLAYETAMVRIPQPSVKLIQLATMLTAKYNDERLRLAGWLAGWPGHWRK